jgi:hypothetical protein
MLMTGTYTKAPYLVTFNRQEDGSVNYGMEVQVRPGSPNWRKYKPSEAEMIGNCTLFTASTRLLDSLKKVIAESDRNTPAYREAKAVIELAEGRA